MGRLTFPILLTSFSLTFAQVDLSPTVASPVIITGNPTSGIGISASGGATLSFGSGDLPVTTISQPNLPVSTITEPILTASTITATEIGGTATDTLVVPPSNTLTTTIKNPYDASTVESGGETLAPTTASEGAGETSMSSGVGNATLSMTEGPSATMTGSKILTDRPTFGANATVTSMTTQVLSPVPKPTTVSESAAGLGKGLAARMWGVLGFIALVNTFLL